MNHIARLQADLAAAKTELEAKAEMIQLFRTHLVSDKFTGFEADGSRRDWIGTRDVFAWVSYIAGRRRDMRFLRRPRHDYEVTDRKRKAALRSQKHQRAKLPLLGPLIAAEQPSIDDLMESRVATWLRTQQAERDRRASLWRRGRRLLEQQPETPRRTLLTYWNEHRWLPGEASYLVDMLHMFSTGRLVIEDGGIRPARAIIAPSEALTVLGSSKPRAKGWLTPKPKALPAHAPLRQNQTGQAGAPLHEPMPAGKSEPIPNSRRPR